MRAAESAGSAGRRREVLRAVGQKTSPANGLAPFYQKCQVILTFLPGNSFRRGNLWQRPKPLSNSVSSPPLCGGCVSDAYFKSTTISKHRALLTAQATGPQNRNKSYINEFYIDTASRASAGKGGPVSLHATDFEVLGGQGRSVEADCSHPDQCLSVGERSSSEPRSRW